MSNVKPLNKLAEYLITHLEKERIPDEDKRISVNSVVSEVASLYEKFRTAMDYREDEVILRSTIERILKRRLLLGGKGENIAEPLIRELVWARYFPDESLSESLVSKVSHTIDLHLKLQEMIVKKHRINRGVVNEWILNILSAEIEHILKPNAQKRLLSNFIYQIFKDRVVIADDTEDVRDGQVFIAVRRAFDKEDLPFLRYHLFKQYFGTVTDEKLEKISDHFLEGYKEIQRYLEYPLKDRIYTYIQSQIIPFLILDDVIREYKGNIKQLIFDEEELDRVILETCNKKYEGIKSRIRRAIVRSALFIFFTKAIFALAIEGTYESVFHGRILWGSIALNTLIPPMLMVVVGSLITTPGRENSFKILGKIKTVLYDNVPKLDPPLVLKVAPKKVDPILSMLFIIFWLLAFFLSFGAIVFVLTNLHFNLVSQAVFLFFLAIVSFITYRIYQTAHMYTVRERKENLSTVLFDFFFMPFIHVGRRLTLGISQINIFLFIFDFIIEAPFKSMFGFFEQWFLYLRTQREKLG